MPLGAEVASAGEPLSEITVTAQRREQKAQDIGISVTAISGDELAELRIARPDDLATQVPGLSVGNAFGNSYPIITLRGVGMNVFDSNQNASVGVYVDDVFVTSPVMMAFQVFDTERVEILRGPQGTLYGRNSSGGAINFVSRRPTDVFESYVTASLGNYDRKEIRGAVSGPLSNSVQARLAIFGRDDRGYQNNRVSEAQGHFAGSDIMAGRLLVSWRPSDRSDVLLNVHGGVDQSDLVAFTQFGTRNPGAIASLCPGFIARRNGSDLRNDPECASLAGGYQDLDGDPHLEGHDAPHRLDNSGYGLSLKADVRFDWGMLSSITGYEYFDRDHREDTDGSPVAFFAIQRFEELDQISQELRFSGAVGGRHNWITGLYYTRDTVDSQQNFQTAPATYDRVVYDQTVTSWAVFGQYEHNFSERWRLTLGGRYTDQETEFVGNTSNYTMVGPVGFATAGDFQFTYAGTDDVFADTDFSWRLGLDRFFGEDVLVYGSAAKGFKSGGFNGNTGRVAETYEPFGSEEVIALALGVKATLLDGRLQLNGEAFHYFYDGLQARLVASSPSGSFTTIHVNVDDSEATGAELEMAWQPASGWLIRAGLSFLDTSYGSQLVQDPVLRGSALVDIKGTSFARAPDVAVNGLVRYERPVADNLLLAFLVDGYYSDQVKMQPDIEGITNQEAFGLLNARVSLSGAGGRWTTSGWIQNLTDREYKNSSILASNFWGFETYGPPRMYGVDLTYSLR